MPLATPRRMLVLALADIGLSPRMQRHALALAGESPDATIELVGYHGCPVQTPLTAEARVHCRRLPAPDGPATLASRWNPMRVVRSTTRALQLAQVVFGGVRPNLLLVQSPAPGGVRTASAAAARVRGARLVIDWHNRARRVGAGADRPNAIRTLTRRERRWARRAHGHLASSQAMASWLKREYQVAAAVLYDRPPSWFVRPDLEAAAELWRKLARDLSLGPRRLPIAVCPTGWTPSDDFDLLLESLERAERQLKARAAPRDGSDPELAVILTGRGALRSTMEARLARRSFSRIAVRTTWLDAEDYAALLGISDLGICLHQSAFGLDLPGVLAECRGVGLPAYAVDYAPVLSEVFETGKHGVAFRDPRDLAAALVGLAASDLDPLPALMASRSWLAAHPAQRWEEHWHEVGRPMLVP